MVKFGKIEMARKSLILKKKPTQILDDNVDIIVISKLVKTETNKATWAKIKDLKSIELNTLPVYDDRYIKSKRRTFDEKVLRYYDCN